MKKYLSIKTLGLIALLIGPNLAFAATFTLGNSNPGFADGSKPGSVAVTNAGSGQPFPFNGIIGTDFGPTSFSASWTFNYAALANVTGGSVTLGVYDGDSAGVGNQVASFSLSSGVTSIDLTSSLNTVFEANGGAKSGIYNIYTLTLPATTIAALASGSVTFALALQNGLGVLGDTAPFNGAALVFSTLDITQQAPPPPQVPLPMAGILFLSGLTSLFAIARRKTGIRS